MIPCISLIIGVTFLIFYICKNTTVIDKRDPENIQLILDLKQLQERIKK
jgi:hypothetical protein